MAVCKPDAVHICDGSDKENQLMVSEMIKSGELKKLPKYDNWLAFYVYSFTTNLVSLIKFF